MSGRKAIGPAALIGGSAAMLVACAAASAADWSIEPAVAGMTTYVTNPRLLPDLRPHDASLAAELSFRLQRKSELTDFSLAPLLRGTRFRDDHTLNHDEASVQSALVHRSELATWTADAAYLRDTTLTSELGVTGLTQATLRHQQITVDAGAEHLWTPRFSTGAQLAWEDDSYQQGPASGLSDYRYSSASLNARYAASEASQWTLTALADRLDLPGNPNLSHDEALRLGYRYSTSPAWVFSFSGGPSHVTTQIEKRSGWVASLQADRIGERGALSMSLARLVRPNGRGVLTTADAASLNVSWALTERLQSLLQLRATRNRDFVPQLGFTYQDIKYGNVEAALAWRWTEAVTLRVSAGANGQRDSYTPNTRSGVYGIVNLRWSGLWGSAER